eukprot:4496925-Prymnesium_polylepis.1
MVGCAECGAGRGRCCVAGGPSVVQRVEDRAGGSGLRTDRTEPRPKRGQAGVGANSEVRSIECCRVAVR